MLMLLCIIATVIPFSLVEGRKGCWADPTPPGKECLYGKEIHGGRNLGIHYIFTSKFTRICCQALECQYWGLCRFKDVWCGQSVSGVPIKANALLWGQRDVEPIMRCYDSRGAGAYYSFTVQVVPIEDR
uniref:Insoluble matrix shell protein 3 n=1 Tax=Ruditapes philippinarum TaxID=129788 RepID=IMSP3_RUDPH|nr:RecName: Full=Insoluble matrix shell protein 3; Short=IMSP3; Flags: Precursor [Ruditapes philippinarum]